MEEQISNENGPKLIKRNNLGLIEGFNYVYKDNYIDWRKLIPAEFLYIDSSKTEETDISKCEDSQLVVKLGGMIYLAKIRGYKSVRYPVIIASESYAAVSCEIEWIPNYETENQSVFYSSTAGVHFNNASPFGMRYSVETAENRAFCKCIRKFLGINIVSQEELGESKPKENIPAETKTDSSSSSSAAPYQVLTKLLSNKGLDFEKLKGLMIKTGDYPGSESYLSITDIPLSKVAGLIERLNKFKNKNA